MRIALIAILTLGLGSGAALAQAGSSPGEVAAAASAKNNVDDCLRLWDAATHMTKQEWATTCRRVQNRLENLKIETLKMDGLGVSPKAKSQK